jgi:hypothetical protein
MTGYSRYRLIWVLVGTGCIAIGTAQAARMYTYDLDSLVYMSSDVVQGELVSNPPADAIGPVDFRITAVYKGTLKKDQVIAVKSLSYRKAVHGDLAKGDQLFLFLMKVQEPTRRGQEKVSDWHAVSSGVRWLKDGRVLTFRQIGNPGPYTAREPRGNDEEDAPLLNDFRKKLNQSLRLVPEYVAALEADPTKLDSELLLRIIGRLPKYTPGYIAVTSGDRLGEVAAEKLAILRDPQLLFRAQAVCQDHVVFDKLGRGFGTATGRDFLLAKVANTKLEMDIRVRCARDLELAGKVYKSDYVNGITPGRSNKLPVDHNNSGYVTRIAWVAGDNLQNEALCLALFSCLDDFFRSSTPKYTDEQLSSDLEGALSILREVSSKKLSEPLRRGLGRIDPARKLADYRQADAHRAKQLICEMEGGATGKKLRLEFTYNALKFKPEVKLRTTLILTEQKSGKRTKVRFKWAIPGGTEHLFSAYLDLPADLPPGKYKLFAEVSDGMKIVATTEPFVVEL